VVYKPLKRMAPLQLRFERKLFWEC
jgi:hypothetical protein